MSLEVHGPSGQVLVSMPMEKLGPRRFRYELEGTPPGLGAKNLAPVRKLCGFVTPATAEGPCDQPMIESLKRDGGDRRRAPRAERLVVEPGEVRLRLSGRMHPDVLQQCFDVAGSKGQHHDLLIVSVDDRPALFLDVTRLGDIRIFSDHAMEVEHQEHVSNVRLHIRRPVRLEEP